MSEPSLLFDGISGDTSSHDLLPMTATPSMPSAEPNPAQPADPFAQRLSDTKQRFVARAASREAAQQKIQDGKLLGADTPERVAKRMERLRIDPATVQALQTGAMSFATVAPSVAAEPSLLERILGTSDLMGITFLELGVVISRTVGRVHCRDHTGSIMSYGTGFMVSPRLMLTNNHVLDSAEMATCSQIEFNYQVGLDGKPTVSVIFGLSPGDLFLTDKELDYTLVAVQTRLPDGRELRDFGWNRLYEAEGKVIVGEYVNIIQHPNGEPKQLALRENRLEDVLEEWLHYRTDTAPGSSGSPVYNDQWEVVALHHSGVPQRDEQGRILTRDGQVWQQSMGEHRINWIANEGARISRIIRHIKAQSLSPTAEHLRAEMFASQPSTPLRTEAPPPGPAEQAARPPTTLAGAQEENAVTWTIPLQVTVRLAQPVLTPAVQIPVVPTPQADTELREALAELADAQTRVYYDEGEDTRAREAYYAGIGPQIDPAAMYWALNKLLHSTHTAQPPYKPGKQVYPWVDLHPDRKLYSIYSGIPFDPETFIREDLRIDAERAQRASALLASEAARGMNSLLEEISLLETALPYNCEHAVPQSWFGKQEPMRGDLHHLFACESDCNSFRGNQAYYDFPDFQEAVRSDCGKREENRFEPSSLKGKGAVARATLYFLLRYPGLVAAVSGEFDVERLPMLLSWHKQSPPDEYERHRNMAIFAVQGNRNPLIDHPDWAEKTDFRLGFGQ